MQHQFIDRGAEVCIAAFSSASINKPARFEWQRKMEEMQVNSLHLTDEARSWWHSCIEETLDVLSKHCPDVLIGSSMGGYGALLFASLRDARAVAFAPQTTLWDMRWEDQLARVRTETKYPQYLTLDMTGDQYEIHYCARHEEDRRQAERMGGVRLVPHSCDHHLIAQQAENLKDLLQ